MTDLLQGAPNQERPMYAGVSVALDETAREFSERQSCPPGTCARDSSAAADNGPTCARDDTHSARTRPPGNPQIEVSQLRTAIQVARSRRSIGGVALAPWGTWATCWLGWTRTRSRRGGQFERVCKWFLTNDPLYRHQVRRVWLWDEWPGRWGADAGIALSSRIVRVTSGRFRPRRMIRDTA
jgi:hypothetical protein